jgi:hypothetical protein
MSKWSITLSREAGIYTTEMTIHAESQELAHQKALEQAKKLDNKEWKYSEDYFLYERPRIQIENSEEVLS